MNNLTALSLSIGLLAGAATFLAVGPLSGVFLIWAATIAWAAYFALGATDEVAKNVVVCGVFGVILATYAAFLITKIGPDPLFGFAFMAAVIVTVSVIVLCLAAYIPALSTIPASVLGYSATFGYLLQTPDKMTPEVLLGASLENPAILISISFAVGIGFAIGSAKLAAKWTTIEG